MTEGDPKPNPQQGGQKPTPKPQEGGVDNPLDKFKEIKEKFEKELAEKDNQIEELKQKLEAKDKEVDDAINNLNDEVHDKLKQSEEYKEILKKVEVLEKERAEATVDAYIQKGVILPTQRETAVKLCLSDNDTFSDLYRDARPIVETEEKRRSIPTGTAERIANYFKN